MDSPVGDRRRLLAAAALASATVVGVAQLLSPTQVVISFANGETVHVGSFFTRVHVAVVACSAVVVGATGMYVLMTERAVAHGDRVSHRAPADAAEDNASAGGSDGQASTDWVEETGWQPVDTAATERPDAQSPGEATDRSTATDSPTSQTDDSTEQVTEHDRWDAVARRLEGTDATVFETVLSAGGTLPQRKIVEQTDLSKATVSRTLSSLETRGLIERERQGVGNVVRLA